MFQYGRFDVYKINEDKISFIFLWATGKKSTNIIFYGHVKMKNNNSIEHENTLNNFHRSFIAELNFFLFSLIPTVMYNTS